MMPALTPAPGHTPVPVNASVTLVAPDQAKVIHSASTDPDMKSHQLRGSPGGEYDERDAVVSKTHKAGNPLEFLTSFGLNQPGTKASYKVFVILKSGNESGSTAVAVQRPAPAPA